MIKTCKKWNFFSVFGSIWNVLQNKWQHWKYLLLYSALFAFLLYILRDEPKQFLMKSEDFLRFYSQPQVLCKLFRTLDSMSVHAFAIISLW